MCRLPWMSNYKPGLLFLICTRSSLRVPRARYNEGMSGRRRAQHTFPTVGALTLLAIGLAIVVLSFGSARHTAPFASSEVNFSDLSPSGLAIVPASCPSNPHTSGECSTGGGGGGGGCPAGSTPLFGGGCSPACPQGQTWNSSSGKCVINCPSPRTVLGGVCQCPLGMFWDGSACLDKCPLPREVKDNECRCPDGKTWDGETCSASCTSGFICQGAALYFRGTNCSLTLQDTCSPSCSGSCPGGLGAPGITIKANPTLVRIDEKSTITWTVSKVKSCFVTGGDDSWTSSGDGTYSQLSSKIKTRTEYVLSCAAKNGSNPTATAVVNIIPVFCEPGLAGCEGASSAGLSQVAAASSAGEDELNATIRAAIMGDSRSSEMTEAEIETMVLLLASEAQKQGVTSADITWRPGDNAETKAAGACGTMPEWMCRLTEAFGFSGSDLVIPIGLGASAAFLLFVLGMMLHRHGHHPVAGRLNAPAMAAPPPAPPVF